MFPKTEKVYYIPKNFDNNEKKFLVYKKLFIFKFKDKYELSFEKNILFSEEISIEKGYNLIERFSPISEFEESWSEEFIGKCERDIIIIN